MKPAWIVFLVLGLVGVQPVAADSQQIRIATLAPTGSPWMQVLERAAAEIADKTDKRVTIKYYAGGQQGDEHDYIRKIKAGQIDGAALTAVGLAMIDSSILVLQLPMMFETQDEVDHVSTKMWPYFQKKFEDKGFRLAERGELGWIYFFSKNKVTSLEELRNQTLPTLGGDKLAGAIADKLKFKAVPLSIAEVDAALTAGRINACLNSPLGAIALQWFMKVKYMNARPLVFGIGATVMSLDAVKKVSADDRKTIDSIAKHSQKKARTVIRKANEDALKTLHRKGITTVEVPATMIEELTKLAGDVQTELTGKLFTKEELEMVLKYRDEYRSKKK